MLWIGQSAEITELKDKEFDSKGANEVKMLAGTVAISASKGGKLNTETAQRVKYAVVSRGYQQQFTDTEDTQYWDLIKAIDAGWRAIVESAPRPCDYRIIIQLVCPELFKQSSINDCILKGDREESKVIKKWRIKSFKVSREALISELDLYLTDKIRNGYTNNYTNK